MGDMDLKWIWQGILTNWLSAGLILAGGVVLAFLKARGARWLYPALYGMVGCALVAIVLYSFAALTAIPKKPTQVTPDTIETSIRTWADTFGLGIKKESESGSYFVYVITLPSSTPVAVSRSRKLDRYISFSTTLTVSPQHSSALERLSTSEMDQISRHVAVEMARFKIGFSLLGPSPLKAVLLVKSVPITSDFTEGSFAEQLSTMDSAVALARETLILNLNRLVSRPSR